MTSFKWKRKIGENVCKKSAEQFALENDANEADKSFLTPLEKRLKSWSAEIENDDSKRYYDEGCILAQEERYWEALKKWDAALRLDPSNEKLYELKSQVYLQLHEVFPAVKSAEKAVELNPKWWVAYQALGRAQMSLGEVQLAIRSFSKSCHLNPELKELWLEDLGWACSVLCKGKSDEDVRQKLGMKVEKIDALIEWSRKVSEKLQ